MKGQPLDQTGIAGLRFKVNATEGNISSSPSITEKQLIGNSENDKLIISQLIISKKKSR